MIAEKIRVVHLYLDLTTKDAATEVRSTQGKMVSNCKDTMQG